jgi:hypothetical protein
MITVLVTLIVLGVAAAILALLFLRGTHVTNAEDRRADPAEMALLDRRAQLDAAHGSRAHLARVRGVWSAGPGVDAQSRPTAAKGWKGKP